MAENLPAGIGLTALAVADARARETERPDRLFEDPFAHLFVDAAGAAFDPAPTEGAIDIRAMRAEYVAVRTRYFDDALLAATAAGCRQVVLLAAGLDTRAFRLRWPAATRLFEVDVADVLAFKARVLAAHQAQPTCERRVVEVDLREDWPAALREAGWHPDQPTAWLAEGILMYLAEPERDALLSRLTAGSAPGSHLALELPAWQVNPQLAESIARGVVDRATLADVASAMPAREAGASERSIADPAAWLSRHGWTPRVDAVADLFVACGRATPGAFANLAGSGPRRLARATRRAA
jgi:methyltransferase (TIGR00027 family)